MILLISSEYDVTSNIVIQWLNNFKQDYIRLNTENFSNLNFYSINNETVKLKIENLDFSKIEKIWHRRGRLRHVPISFNNTDNISLYLKKEEDSLIKTIENYLKSKVLYIGSYLKEIENFKLEHLIKAKESNLIIPDTIVTTSKIELLKFKSKHKLIISKDIRYPANIKTNNINISSIGTFIIQEKTIKNLCNNFAPIFVQEYIEKEFEIRVFFFINKLYSMCIFSQKDEKTKIDYRNYNKAKPNRFIPFNLPNNIKEKLLVFINKIHLTTGSIDLIYSKKNEFVFLEVNPMGQFDWVSKYCNYYIEKEIAINLSSNVK